MTAISKKATTTKKPEAHSAKAKTATGAANKSTKKSVKTNAASALSQRQKTHVEANTDRSVRHDAKTDRLVGQANKHMERAWGKIYAQHAKDGKAA